VTSVSNGSASEPLKGPEGDRLALSLYSCQSIVVCVFNRIQLVHICCFSRVVPAQSGLAVTIYTMMVIYYKIVFFGLLNNLIRGY
jgi:hypothetical protein